MSRAKTKVQEVTMKVRFLQTESSCHYFKADTLYLSNGKHDTPTATGQSEVERCRIITFQTPVTISDEEI